MIPAPKLNDKIGIELNKRLWNSYSDLMDFFHLNRIFFSNEIQEKMSWLSGFYTEHLLKNQNIQVWESNRYLYNSEDYNLFLENKYQELKEFHDTQLPKILSELEDKFREILGVQ